MAGVLRFRYAIAILVMLTLWAGLPVGASAQSESTLHDRIERGREHERVLSGAVARLSTLISRTGREITIVQGRLDDVQADLVAARARVERTQAELRAERIKLLRLRRRFAEGRAVLASQLVAMYKADPPDVVSLVLGSHSFADLLDRVVFVKRVTERNAAVVERVRTERGQTQRQTTLLARLEDKRRDEADAVQRRQNALSSMRDGLAARQRTQIRARAARAAALAGTRAGRRAAKRALARLLAARAAAASSAGPGGPWAIPWPIVQCESGGQNLSPNRAGASGYYQFLPTTWRNLGGSTPAAYQASKAEQDRLAARLWAAGAGAHNWDCAGLVG